MRAPSASDSASFRHRASRGLLAPQHGLFVGLLKSAERLGVAAVIRVRLDCALSKGALDLRVGGLRRHAEDGPHRCFRRLGPTPWQARVLSFVVCSTAFCSTLACPPRQLSDEDPRPRLRPARLDLREAPRRGLLGFALCFVPRSRSALGSVGFAKRIHRRRPRPPRGPEVTTSSRRRDRAHGREERGHVLLRPTSARTMAASAGVSSRASTR